jgi:hypothetical protein
MSPQSISQIIRPVLDALDSIGLDRLEHDIRGARPTQVFAELRTASAALFAIFDVNRHLRGHGGAGLSRPDYDRIDAVHEVVLEAMRQVAAIGSRELAGMCLDCTIGQDCPNCGRRAA